ncbi:MAG TPA: hypothetical protein VIN05_06045 [Roseovarius sp.]
MSDPANRPEEEFVANAHFHLPDNPEIYTHCMAGPAVIRGKHGNLWAGIGSGTRINASGRKHGEAATKQGVGRGQSYSPHQRLRRCADRRIFYGRLLP